MKPTRLFARNFGPYADVDWTVPIGVTAIIGQNEAGEGISSNGAGKTMLLSILPLALWGPPSWSDVVAAGSDEVCEIGCEFEHGGGLYRIRRTYNPSGRGKTSCDFEEALFSTREGYTDDRWTPLTRDTQAATQEAIKNLLGIGEATFHHSVFAAQGARHFADAELTPKERGEILADGLGLDVWDGFREVAAADRLLLEREEAALSIQIDAQMMALDDRDEIEATARVAERRVTELQQNLDVARAQYATLDNQYRTAREALASCSAAEREADALLSTVRELERQEEAAAVAAAELVELVLQLGDAHKRALVLVECADKVAELRGLEQARAKAETERAQLVHDHDRLVADANLFASGAKSKDAQYAELLKAESPECDRCNQPLPAAARTVVLDRVQAEAEALWKQSDDRNHEAMLLAVRIAAIIVPEAPAPAEIEQAETNLANARIAETEAARLAGRVESLSAVVEGSGGPEHAARLAVAREGHTEAQERVVALRANVQDEAAVQELAKNALGAQVEVERLDRELAEARTAHGTATERARALAEVAAQHEAALAQRTALQFDLDVLRELEKAYGRAGIPVLLLESLYVPQIERHANDVLAAWGVPYTVELVTQKALKSSDRLRDTMEVVVRSPDGPRRYQTFSGGEKDRISTALRIALARTIGSHRGHSLEVFALDELAHLDSAGVEKLAELLCELQREIPVVLFISHDQNLSDAFDQRVVVVREGAHSRLEMAA